MSASQEEIPPPPPPPPSSQTPTQQTPISYPIWEVTQNGNVLYNHSDKSGQIKMWDAIKSRFGGNDESKKMQKYILKQQFEGFSISNTEGLHKGYDRFQSLLSQLEIHGAGVSTEDANQKFLRSLPSAWSQVSLIMRTKPGVDSLSFDDLYNNLRVFESDIKGSTASSSSPQNVAFVSENTSSTNEVSTAYCVPNLSGQNSKYEQTSSYSLLANQSSCPQLDHEDLEQIDEYDLEEMDLKWQVAMISMRMKKFYKKTGHFARECRIKGTQDNRRRDAWNSGNKDGSRTVQKEDSKALVTIDGEGVDWTNHSEDEDYALMAANSSDSDTESVFRNKESEIENQPLYDRFVTAKGMHAVPPPMTGNYMPSGPDVEIDDSKFTYGPKQTQPSESESQSSEFDTCESNISAKPSELVSEPVVNESNVECQPKGLLLDFQHRALKNKGIVDSGCSRHMTGNKAYLAEFQDFNGGLVAFGGSKGYITGKGKIKTGELAWFIAKGFKTDESNKWLGGNTVMPELHIKMELLERKEQDLIGLQGPGLQDSFSTYTFWAEEVSTAWILGKRVCYVLLKPAFVLPIWPYASIITPALKSDDMRVGQKRRKKKKSLWKNLERLRDKEMEAYEEAEALRRSLRTCTASPYEGLSLSTDPTNPEEDDSEIPLLEDIYQYSTDDSSLIHLIMMRVQWLTSQTWNLLRIFLRTSALCICLFPVLKHEHKRFQKLLKMKVGLMLCKEGILQYEIIVSLVLSRFAYGMKVYQMDVKSAFLYGKIDEEYVLVLGVSSFDLESYSDSDYVEQILDSEILNRRLCYFLSRVSVFGCYYWDVGHQGNQGNRNRDAPRRNAPVDTSTTNALVVQDGIGYQMGLDSLEARIVIHEKNEAVYEENNKILKYDVQVKDISIKDLKNQLEEALKEKDDLKLKLEKFEESSKNLTKLINSQISAKDKTSLGYDGQMNESELNNIHMNKSEVVHSVFNSRESDVDDNPVNDRFKTGEGFHAVPPPYTRNYMPPRPDLSFAGLDESVFKSAVRKTTTSVPETETSISKTSKDIVEKPKTVRPSAPIIEE
ncbi:hypothetical protein Tco_0978457 [Tanacetum coccineum]|uniref:Retrovirus-related Pol polyprotein from transposon TNT 1-94-like beta-barrel domain-containing protein n=1 Tax=Tanacetum coccineum TaxID=301880 RepID=A0ABQ5EN42_9ASTR